MSVKQYGTFPQIVFGEAINTTDKQNLKDVQGGEAICRWHGFHGDDIKDEDLPACKLMGTTENHNLAGYGGNHFGLIGKNDKLNPTANGGGGDSRGKRGTPVVGIALGPQHFMIMGSMGSHGHGDTDGKANIDSDTPHSAKDQDYKGPQKGDINQKADNKSVLQWAKDIGGPGKKASQHADLQHSIGGLAPLET